MLDSEAGLALAAPSLMPAALRPPYHWHRRMTRQGYAAAVLLVAAVLPVVGVYVYLEKDAYRPLAEGAAASAWTDSSHFEYPVADGDACGPASQRGEDVLRWAAALGARVHPHLAVASVDLPSGGDGERGLVASKAILDGTVLVVCPRALHMSVTFLRNSSALRDVYDFLDQNDIVHSSLFGLAFLLLHEARNTSSFWRPYLCALPRHPASAFLMPPAQRDNLRRQLPPDQWWRFDREVQRQLSRSGALHHALKNYLGRFPARFRLEDYSLLRIKWALAILASRAFSTFDASLRVPVHTLVPCIDLPNHDAAGRPVRETSKGDMELLAHTSLEPGSAVLTSYGVTCAAVFLAHYGFAPAASRDAPCTD